MSDCLPFQVPNPLPSKIEVCPIVEAIFELRFTSRETWTTMPGLLYDKIRERYPTQKQLELASVPEEVRNRDQGLARQPLVMFGNDDFAVHFGPRVIALVTKPNQYPGWSVIEQELNWLLERLRATRIIDELERLGVRYVDFFQENIFNNLILNVAIGGQTLEGELRLAVVLKPGSFIMRIVATNAAIVGIGLEARNGSVFDVDVWLNSLDFDLFNNGIDKFRQAHLLVKQCFFGLAKPEFLISLKPSYE
jgi:uncharacterized protein (TIGR04255 family)